MNKHIITLLFASLTALSSLTAQCWNLVWEDEFTGTTVNTANWGYDIGAGGWGNNELQYYTSRVENAAVANGSLKIKALEESYSGSNYTSARMVTRNKVSFAYGKLEARIKLPTGQGIWPAFWALPEESYYGGWPYSGEIDVMELIGNLPARVYGTDHASNNGGLVSSGGNYNLPTGIFADDFHTFKVEWEPGIIRHYCDDVLYHTNTQASLGANPWPFDRPFHILLNIAVGGNWPGAPNATTVFPQTMEVDWVRIYQKLEDLIVIGPVLAEPEAAGKTYKIANIPAATFNWTVPTGATIVSGQGTNMITVNWGNTGGNVSVTVANSCGTVTRSLAVTVSPNIWNNPDFEQDLQQWAFRKSGTANGSVAITTTGVQQGLKAAVVTCTAAGANPWDLQLSRTADVIAGQSYTLRFWAKADMNRLFSVAFIHPTNYNSYASSNFTATTSWQEFSLTFNAPAGVTQLLYNMDLARFGGAVYTFDHFILGRTVLLPVEYLSGLQARTTDNGVVLDWTTAMERDNKGFELERSENGIFFNKIATIAAKKQGNSNQEYRYLDANPLEGMGYYRLKQLDTDGKSSVSNICSAVWKSASFVVFPNPATDFFEIKSDQTYDKIVLVNSLGQPIRTYLPNDEKKVFGLNGTYWLEVYYGTKVVTQRIVLGN
jgi:beta-glucanase (GH16 family)